MIKKYISIIIAFFIILYFIFRIIRSYFIFQISEPVIINNFSYFKLFIICFSICLYSYLIYKHFKNSNNENYFTKLLIKLINYINDSLILFYELYIFPYFINYIQKITLNFFLYYNSELHKKYMYIIYFICFILPKLLISFALLIDIIYFNKIYYLYKILWIIWIPLLLRILIFIINHYGLTIKNHIMDHYNVIPIKENETIIAYDLLRKDINSKFLIEYKNISGFFKIVCLNILFYHIYELEQTKSWVKYFNLLINIFFLIAWGFRLYLILL